MLAKNFLGNSGLEVTEFCLGILPMGPLQANLGQQKCVEIIEAALDAGVAFFDTAESYGTQEHLGQAVGERRKKVVIATKSLAEDYAAMAASVERSLRELNTTYIDIYHLHAPMATPDLFQQRAGALRYLQQAKGEKLIKAVGVATHNPAVVRAAAGREDIDVIFALINKAGKGIWGGTLEEMKAAIKLAHASGKGVYAMKALAGGNLIGQVEESLNWVRRVEGISAVAVGVVSKEELYCDLSIFGVQGLSYDAQQLSRQKQLHVIKNLCKGCGSCLESCPNEALQLLDGKATVDKTKCLLCGYCYPSCPQFAIRVF